MGDKFDRGYLSPPVYTATYKEIRLGLREGEQIIILRENWEDEVRMAMEWWYYARWQKDRGEDELTLPQREHPVDLMKKWLVKLPEITRR
jgi:hypothetical protein